MVCLHGKKGRGLSQCEHFADRDGGQFYADVLYGRPLRWQQTRIKIKGFTEMRIFGIIMTPNYGWRPGWVNIVAINLQPFQYFMVRKMSYSYKQI